MECPTLEHQASASLGEGWSIVLSAAPWLVGDIRNINQTIFIIEHLTRYVPLQSVSLSHKSHIIFLVILKH